MHLSACQFPTAPTTSRLLRRILQRGNLESGRTVWSMHRRLRGSRSPTSWSNSEVSNVKRRIRKHEAIDQPQVPGACARLALRGRCRGRHREITRSSTAAGSAASVKTSSAPLVAMRYDAARAATSRSTSPPIPVPTQVGALQRRQQRRWHAADRSSRCSTVPALEGGSRPGRGLRRGELQGGRAGSRRAAVQRPARPEQVHPEERLEPGRRPRRLPDQRQAPVPSQRQRSR